MNGLEKITGRIQTDAQCEMDALEREARTKADLLLAAGRERADALMAEGRQQNEALAASQKARLVSAANMESRQMVLQAKQSCIDAVFDQAKARLLALPAAEYTEFLAKWVANAAETGTEELIFSAGTRNEIGQQVANRANQLRPGAAFALSGETREIDGVILRRGNVEINGSLSAHFQLLRERMASEVAQVLFS